MPTTLVERRAAFGRASAPPRTYPATIIEVEEHERGPLFYWNVAAALLHFAVASVVIIAGNRQLEVQFFVMSMETRNREEGDWLLRPTGVNEAGFIHLIGTIAAFELLTALFHAGNAFLWYETYLAWVSDCYQPLRWFEYAITAPLMILLISIFSGHVNLYTLITLMALTSVTMAFGYVTELLARPTATSTRWEPLARGSVFTPHFLGYLPQLVVWGIIIPQFVRYARAEGKEDNGIVINKMPEWVYGLFVAEILLFWSFACVQLYVLARGPQAYSTGEKTYLVLSFVSKATLSLIIFGGTMNLSLDNRSD